MLFVASSSKGGFSCLEFLTLPVKRSNVLTDGVLIREDLSLLKVFIQLF